MRNDLYLKAAIHRTCPTKDLQMLNVNTKSGLRKPSEIWQIHLEMWEIDISLQREKTEKGTNKSRMQTQQEEKDFHSLQKNQCNS